MADRARREKLAELKENAAADARRIGALEGVIRDLWALHDVSFTLSVREVRERMYDALTRVSVPSRRED